MFLALRQLAIQYPGRRTPAVQGVNLGLHAGDIGVLIGPSGCGKTTLLRAVAGLEPISEGQILLSGRTVSAPGHTEAAERRRIGMVFQDYALFPHMDVGRNVGFGLNHLPKAERQQRVTEVLALVGLAGAEHHFPHELSGGQQQRVALARALAPRPDLLLLDEPFSNLDVDLRERLAHEVRTILKAANATALLVTHDQLEAFAIGDVIGVMHEGQLHQWDDAYSLYHRPATRFVADFIGHGVFTHATLREVDGQVVVQTPVGDLSDVSECPLPSASKGAVRCAAAGGRHRARRQCPGEGRDHPQGVSRFRISLHTAPGHGRVAHGPCAQPPRSQTGRVDRHPCRSGARRDLQPRKFGLKPTPARPGEARIRR